MADTKNIQTQSQQKPTKTSVETSCIHENNKKVDVNREQKSDGPISHYLYAGASPKKQIKALTGELVFNVKTESRTRACAI